MHLSLPTLLRRRPRSLLAALLGAAALLAARPAAAENGLLLIDAPPAEGYSLSAGPALLGYPSAPGSGRTETLLIPGVDFYSSLGFFASTEMGLGWNFSRRQDLQYGLRLWPVTGRDDDDDARLGRLDRFGTRLGRGVFLNYAPWEFLTLQSSVLAGSGRNGSGVQAEVGATVGARLGQASLVGLTLGTTWANRAHRRDYFGVTPQESQASGLPAWSPGAGWQDVSLALSGEIPINDRWKLSGQVSSTRLLGDAADSPVSPSRYDTNFSLTLWYRFK